MAANENMVSEERRSPIKNLPVRVPGQSIDKEIDRLIDDRVLPWLLAAGFALVIACAEWCRFWFKMAVSPWAWTILAVITVCLAVWRARAIIKKAKALRLGQIGELAVGQHLEEVLRPKGYHVLHDVPGTGFNLDHVVIGPTGIFCVETKTRSKPLRGNSIVKVDGEAVTVNGFAPDRDPIVQTKASARYLCELVESTTGKKFHVQPVVLFPGWFVEGPPETGGVWVLNEKAFPTFVQNAKHRLSSEDVNLIVFHLKRFVITETERMRQQ
jgi:hypothetical protein